MLQIYKFILNRYVKHRAVMVFFSRGAGRVTENSVETSVHSLSDVLVREANVSIANDISLSNEHQVNPIRMSKSNAMHTYKRG